MLAMFFITRNPVTPFNAYLASILFLRLMMENVAKYWLFEVLLLGNILLVWSTACLSSLTAKMWFSRSEQKFGQKCNCSADLPCNIAKGIQWACSNSALSTQRMCSVHGTLVEAAPAAFAGETSFAPQKFSVDTMGTSRLVGPLLNLALLQRHIVYQ